MEIKIDKRGKITIPKSIRDELGFTSGVAVRIYADKNYGIPKITHCSCNVICAA